MASLDGRIHVVHHREHLVYNPASTHWSKAEPMPTPRHGQAAAVMGGQLYVVGGCHEQLFDLDIVERFVPAVR
jgi:N-acetylneuraminic acid mutarotase